MASCNTGLRVRICSQVYPDDDSILSILAYAVDHLKVKYGQCILVSQVEAARAPPQETNTPLLPGECLSQTSLDLPKLIR